MYFNLTVNVTPSNNEVNLGLATNDFDFIDWGDGTSSNYIPSNPNYGLKQWNTFGDFTISIRYPNSSPIYFSSAGNRGSALSGILTGVSQWPDNEFTFLNFADSNLLVSLPSVSPNFAPNADLTDFLRGCSIFNSPFSLDTSNVTLMDNMFYQANIFDQPINFNTSNVTSMRRMFYQAYAFNQEVNFDTGNVTDMTGMFSEATLFDQAINFNTENVIDMSNLFSLAISFNHSVNFDTSNVYSTLGMFASAYLFNRPLNFNTQSLSIMDGMFYRASSFNQNIGNFNVTNVTSMEQTLSFSNMNITNYNATLQGWASQTVLPNVTLRSDGLFYSDSVSRSILTSAPNNWTILNDVFQPIDLPEDDLSRLFKFFSIKACSKTGTYISKVTKTSSNKDLLLSQDIVLHTLENIIKNCANNDYKRSALKKNGLSDIYIFYDPTSLQNPIPSSDILYQYLINNPLYTLIPGTIINDVFIASFIRYLSSQVFNECSTFFKKLSITTISDFCKSDSINGFEICVENCMFTLSLSTA